MRQDHGWMRFPKVDGGGASEHASLGPLCHVSPLPKPAMGRASGPTARAACRTLAFASSAFLATACSLGSDPAANPPHGLIPPPPGVSGPPPLDPYVPGRETVIVWVEGSKWPTSSMPPTCLA